MHQGAGLFQDCPNLIDSGNIRPPQTERDHEVSSRQIGYAGDAAGVGSAQGGGRCYGMGEKCVMETIFSVHIEERNQAANRSGW